VLKGSALESRRVVAGKGTVKRNAAGLSPFPALHSKGGKGGFAGKPFMYRGEGVLGTLHVQFNHYGVSTEPVNEKFVVCIFKSRCPMWLVILDAENAARIMAMVCRKS
jgi:hypothetical protein